MEKQKKQEREGWNPQKLAREHVGSSDKRRRQDKHSSHKLHSHDSAIVGAKINHSHLENDRTARPVPQNEYVCAWLAKTAQGETTATFPNAERWKENTPHSTERNPTWSRNHNSAHRVGDHNSEQKCPGRKSHKQSLECSSDSSLLEHMPHNCESKYREVSRSSGHSNTQRNYIAPYKQRKAGLIPLLVCGTSPSPHRQRQETYERRKRHRTREDLYEPGKNIKVPESYSKVERKKNGKNREGSRRKAEKTGKDLMENFSSRRVGSDRLTMHPSERLGIFRNGRASSPLRRRGLPDLSFSEMAFLQHSTQHAANSKDQKAIIRSQGKDIRRRQNMQNEISSFFKPNGKQSSEMYTSPGPDVPESRLGDGCVLEPLPRKPTDPRHQSVYSVSTPQSLRFPERTFLTISHRNPTPGEIPQERFIEAEWGIDNAESMISGRSTTYYTWSDSVRSPDAKRQRIHTSDSTTPELIRRSLDETGIFENTGIVRGVGGKHIRYIEEDIRHRNGINSAPGINLSSELSTVSGRLPVNDVETLVSKEMAPQNPKNGAELESQDGLIGGQVDHHSLHPVLAISPPEQDGPKELITGGCNPDSGYQKTISESELGSHNRCESTINVVPRQILARDAYLEILIPAGTTEEAGNGGARFSSVTSRRAQDTATQGVDRGREEKTRDTPMKANGSDNTPNARVAIPDGITSTTKINNGPHMDKAVSSGKPSSSSVVGNESVLNVGRKLAPSTDLHNGQAYNYPDVCDLANSSLLDTSPCLPQQDTHTFENPLTRGSQACRDIRPLPQVSITHRELVDEPLYARQLKNQALQAFETTFEGPSLSPEGFQCYDYSLSGEDSLLKNELYGGGIGGGHVKDELDLHLQDAPFLEPIDDGCFIAEGDAQFGGPTAYHDNGLALFATHDYLDETPTTNIFDRQYGASLAHSHFPNYHPVQRCLGHIHESIQDSSMKRFWQPRRHN